MPEFSQFFVNIVKSNFSVATPGTWSITFKVNIIGHERIKSGQDIKLLTRVSSIVFLFFLILGVI